MTDHNEQDRSKKRHLSYGQGVSLVIIIFVIALGFFVS
jgi:hypothetical protein